MTRSLLLITLGLTLMLGCEKNRPNSHIASVAVSVDGTTPPKRMVLAGATDVEITHLHFAASDYESLSLRKLRLYVEGDASAILQLRLLNGATTLATGFVTAGYVTLVSLDVVIPPGDAVDLTVTADLVSSTQVLTVGGMSFRIYVRNMEDDWIDNVSPSAPNGSVNGSGETGDIQVITVDSGIAIVNTEDPLTDQLVGDRGVGNSANDFVGNTALSANILAKRQYVTNSLLTLELDPASPSGHRGAATGATVEVFRFVASATYNPTASTPRQIYMPRIIIAFADDAEVDQLELFGPSNNYASPISTSATRHKTNTPGFDPAVPANHILGITTFVTFDITGPDNLIDYGSSKMYFVQARVYALTDNNQPIRSLRPSISYGPIMLNGSGVEWWDNDANPDSHRWDWMYNAQGYTELQPTSPLTYTGSSFIP